jgi:hypothetical protein
MHDSLLTVVDIVEYSEWRLSKQVLKLVLEDLETITKDGSELFTPVGTVHEPDGCQRKGLSLSRKTGLPFYFGVD